MMFPILVNFKMLLILKTFFRSSSIADFIYLDFSHNIMM